MSPILDAANTLAADSFGDNALHRCKTPEEVDALIKLGLDVNARNIEGETPLHYACFKGVLKVAEALLGENAIKPEMSVQTLVNQPDGNGRTPLHAACMAGHRDVAKMLMCQGSDMNAKDSGGDTPLHLACDNGRLEVARALIDAGAEVNGVGIDRMTPFEMCRTDEMRALFTAKSTPRSIAPDLSKQLEDFHARKPDSEGDLINTMEAVFMPDLLTALKALLAEHE